MKVYTVYTREFRENGPEEGAVIAVVSRTERKTAEEDAALLRDIGRRAAWIEEEER